MVGENLSSYPNLDFLVADDATQLLKMLKEIRLPYKIVSMYGVGSRHYAWVSLTRPIKKKKVTKKKLNPNL